MLCGCGTDGSVGGKADVSDSSLSDKEEVSVVPLLERERERRPEIVFSIIYEYVEI